MKLILGNQNEICNQNSAETSDSPLVMSASESGCKPVFLNFNGSNAGVLALKQVDRQLGQTEAMAKAIVDKRDQRYIDHTYPELLRQRTAQIACGYEDANDCNALRTDPSFKIFSGRNPESGDDLSSQRTMSRFENAISRTSLYRLAKVEVSERRTNLRFTVTDMDNTKATVLYRQIYCARGAAELNIKEHKLYLKSDRTSCHRFEANQFRLFLHSAAYVLFHALRTNILKHTQWAKASIETLRLRFLKTGACVREFENQDLGRPGIKLSFETAVDAKFPNPSTTARNIAIL